MWVNEGARVSQEETVHPASRALFRYWDETRGGRSAPSRQDLDLKQIRKFVPNLFIAEQAGPEQDFRWRLAGTAICGLFRREVTGQPLFEGWAEFEGSVVRRFLYGVTGKHQQALLRFSFTTDRDQQVVAELAAFPLLAADGARTQVLGGLFTFAGAELKDYQRITSAELLSARFAAGELLAAVPEDVPAQARRKFRVITGGLDQP